MAMMPIKDIIILNEIKNKITNNESVTRRDGTPGTIIHKQRGGFDNDIILMISYDDNSEESYYLRTPEDLLHFESIGDMKVSDLMKRFG